MHSERSPRTSSRMSPDATRVRRLKLIRVRWATDGKRWLRRPVHHFNARSIENIAAISARVAQNSNLSLPPHSQQFGLSYSSLWRILHLDLHLRLYKVQLTQKLNSADHSPRRRYVEWLFEQQARNSDFSKKMYSATRPLHPKKSLWCALWYGGVIGTYFFKNDAVRTVNVNVERYGRMITDLA